MSPAPVRRPSGGYSLVELVVTMAVMLGGMLSVIGLFPAGIRMSRKARDTLLGGIIAKHACGQAARWIYEDLAGRAPTGTLVDPAHHRRAPLSTRINFKFTGGAAHTIHAERRDRSPGIPEAPVWLDTNGGVDPWVDHYCVITTGKAAGKVFRISDVYWWNKSGCRVSLKTIDGTNVAWNPTTRPYELDARDSFTIVGKLGETLAVYPDDTFLTGQGGRYPIQPYVDTASSSRKFSLAQYSYVCLISAPHQPGDFFYPVQVVIYRNYDPDVIPSDQASPVARLEGSIPIR